MQKCISEEDKGETKESENTINYIKETKTREIIIMKNNHHKSIIKLKQLKFEEGGSQIIFSLLFIILQKEKLQKMTKAMIVNTARKLMTSKSKLTTDIKKETTCSLLREFIQSPRLIEILKAILFNCNQFYLN